MIMSTRFFRRRLIFLTENSPRVGPAYRGSMMTDEEIEREQIKAVFFLDDSELEDEPWGDIQYWYEGCPSYLGTPDYTDMYSREYRTGVQCLLYAGELKAPEGWEIMSSYTTSGERVCCCEGPRFDTPNPDCPLCEGDGLIYIGDGWAEVVYRALED